MPGLAGGKQGRWHIDIALYIMAACLLFLLTFSCQEKRGTGTDMPVCLLLPLPPSGRLQHHIVHAALLPRALLSCMVGDI